MSHITNLRQQELLRRARTSFFQAMPGQFERHRMGGRALERLQTDRLRRLLNMAKEYSPYYRGRLSGIDVTSFSFSDMPQLAPMTKDELMAEFDAITTDKAVTLKRVNRHLQSLSDEPMLFEDRYVVLASGGISGTRGVFVSDLEEAAQQMAAVLRGGLAGMAETVGWPPPGPIPLTIVAAPTTAHATRGLASIFLGAPFAAVTFAPVTAPFDEIVEIVQRSQPMLLVGYPSVIAQLADAQTDGRLSIQPTVVSVTSEQLTENHVARITGAFGIAPTNSFGTSEGLMGTAPPGSPVFSFVSDNAYVEFVDVNDNPIGIGETADHVLVTNLYNHSQPLIRYRIDDIMTPAPAGTGHGHQRATVEGRKDELLEIGGVTVHPLTLRSPLVTNPDVGDYQVRLHGDGSIAVDIVAIGNELDVNAVGTSLEAAIVRTGARPGPIHVRQVDNLPRDSRTGKTRRFLASPSDHPAPTPDPSVAPSAAAHPTG